MSHFSWRQIDFKNKNFKKRNKLPFVLLISSVIAFLLQLGTCHLEKVIFDPLKRSRFTKCLNKLS